MLAIISACNPRTPLQGERGPRQENSSEACRPASMVYTVVNQKPCLKQAEGSEVQFHSVLHGCIARAGRQAGATTHSVM